MYRTEQNGWTYRIYKGVISAETNKITEVYTYHVQHPKLKVKSGKKNLKLWIFEV